MQIAEIECSFTNSKNNLSFNVQEQTGYINLITDATQLAEASKLLLLSGKGKTFTVRFYDTNTSEIEENFLNEINEVAIE